MTIPRSEYPRPQFVRKDWLCLNGEWQFEMDPGDSGLERGLLEQDLAGAITVPFCMESELSGVGNIDFCNAVWYRREVEIPSDWAGRKVLLHFQAADYETTVWVNGREVGRHRGGWSPFTCDLGGTAAPGDKTVVVVRVRDRKGQLKPRGKQITLYHNRGCSYTRTTGIWQTVWMEPVPDVHLKRPRITPDVAGRRFRIEQPVSNNTAGLRLRATLKDDAGEVAAADVAADADFAPQLDLVIPEDRVRLWGPGEPNLYDITLELVGADGAVVDSAESYAGLRSITIDGLAVKINGVPVFQRQVLDQGYYPDGIMTAPTDDALRADIEMSMAAGFNSARLHQKVFEERFFYHADKLGYLVWGEFGDWGMDRERPEATYVAQWLEVLLRDYSHPSIVGWCPLNETSVPITDEIDGLNDLQRGLFLAAKATDATRPVLDSSGYSHRVPEIDVYDCHDYSQDPDVLRENQAGLADGKPFVNTNPRGDVSLPYKGQPFFVSEFGGIKWNPDEADGTESWGYGNTPKTLDEFYERFEALCNVLLDNPNMFGYCYTQLTDIFQEQNGLYYFDRRPKFDNAKLHAVQTRPAAIERE
ncbi:MAG: sugar-binding domain-containing protein [Planctomycetota bacterium]